MSLHGTNGSLDENGMPQIEMFQKPLFQTFGMFVGMMFGLIMHWFVVAFKLPFPGYDFDHDGADDEGDVEIPTEKTSLTRKMKAEPNVDTTSKEIPMWMYFFLAIPAIFDLAATGKFFFICVLVSSFLRVVGIFG